jgi:acylpyruvate hydrolase
MLRWHCLIGLVGIVVFQGSRTQLTVPPACPHRDLQIGKNYAKHKVEMGGTAERLSKPLFFLKPNSSIIAPGEPIVIPTGCKEVHHEVELGVIISGTARKVTEADAMSFVGGWVLSLDMTARDWQADAKAKGQPWSLSKGCDTFCPMSDVIPVTDKRVVAEGMVLKLSVNGEERQNGSTADMLHSVPELIAYVSSVMTLEDGDVILTGTPEGVGPAGPGSTIDCSLSTADGDVVASMSFPVRAEESD